MSDRNKRCNIWSNRLTESRHGSTMGCGINNTFAGYLLPLGEIKQGYKEGEKGTLWRYILESKQLMTWQLTESGMGQDFNQQIDVEVVKNLGGLLWCWHGKKKRMTDVTDIWFVRSHQCKYVAPFDVNYVTRGCLYLQSMQTLFIYYTQEWNVMPCIIKHSAKHWD